MSNLVLERFCYSETETEGRLWLDDVSFVYTLERPWVGGMSGGVPSISCVPDGEYELRAHTRHNGDEVYALWNPDLAVYHTLEERGNREGRYAILIHSGNYVHHSQGCVLPGKVRTIHTGLRAVLSSRAAMREIMEWHWDTLTIQSSCGASNE